jgi:hypothetical protein
MRIFICLTAAALVCAAGCESPTTVAMVVQNDDMTIQDRNVAPTIPLERPDGKMTTVAQAAAPFYLIAFVEVPADQPNTVPAPVNNIAKRLWLDSVDVVQFTEPPAGQTFPADALQMCPPRNDNIILVLDPKRKALAMFHTPAMGTLMLVDKYGYIVDTGSLTKSKDIMFKTDQMAKEWNEREWVRSFSLDSND